MKIKIRIPVKGNYKDLLKRFDKDLFLALAPPGVPVKLVRFEGSEKGNIVHIRLNLLGISKQDWVSEITENEVLDTHCYFTDEGVKLPFFLSYWKHKHIIERKGEDQSEIVEDIEFKTPFFLMDYLMYPILYLQFYYRKPIYQRLFGKPI